MSMYNKPPEERTVEELLRFAVVFIDKPKGPTSHQVSAWVRSVLHVPKAGHAGTLDPNVTGILPVALNKATRIVNLVHLEAKEYVVLLRLHKDAERSKIENVMKEFEGTIFQTPPVRAAVARRLRKREIYKIEILEIEKREVLFKVSTEAGTYIRTLCVDIGDAMGTGAHMEELRRIKTGPFDESVAVKLQDLVDAYYFYKNGDESQVRKLVRPGEILVSFLPKIIIKDSAIDAVAHGARLYVKGVKEISMPFVKGNIVSLFSTKGELIAVANAVIDSKKVPDMYEGVVAEPQEVIIPRGEYPQVWRKKTK